MADAVVGNPPFLGTKRMRAELGDETVDRLFAAYRGSVRPEADFVCYWFANAWDALQAGRLTRAGLVSTNSIRGGANRAVLKSIADGGRIFAAWGDEEWTVEGAAVRVSLVCFDSGHGGPALLDGTAVAEVYPDLTARRADGSGVDLTRAGRLLQNRGSAFMGDTKGGAFDVPGDLARQWLSLPLNPNGRPNADVLRPWVNGMDLTRRPVDKWIIDFGWTMTEPEAAFYEGPFSHAEVHIRPERVTRQSRGYAKNWWIHERPRQEMWAALIGLPRAIVTPTVAKHRIFKWLSQGICPDHQLIAIARDDDATFETFPFPEGLTPDIPATAYADDPRAQRIATAAARLNELRENWLNPSDLVDRVPEVVPGYPDRLLPKNDVAAAELKKRTLTNLYNARPAWLDHAHLALDEAVAEAYGWGDDWRDGKLTDDEILARLFRLNQERAAVAKA